MTKGRDGGRRRTGLATAGVLAAVLLCSPGAVYAIGGPSDTEDTWTAQVWSALTDGWTGLTAPLQHLFGATTTDSTTDDGSDDSTDTDGDGGFDPGGGGGFMDPDGSFGG